MTAAQLTARQANADRRARDLKPAVRFLSADRWAVESARRDVTYLLTASVDGVRCSCPAADQGMPCYHASAVLLAVVAIQPEPPTPAAPAVRRCHECGGRDSAGMCPLCFGAGVYAA